MGWSFLGFVWLVEVVLEVLVEVVVIFVQVD